MLKIYLLGPFRLLRNQTDVPESVWHTKQARQLLKILLTQRGKIVARDYLIDMLWPEADPAKAATTLRTAVNALRKTLEPDRPPYTPSSYILAHAPGYRFQFTDQVWVDALTFDNLLNQAAETNNPTQRQSLLTQAIALYQDDYLPDDPYADWAFIERERLRERYLTALAALAEYQAEQGNVDRAIAHLRRVISRDPGREPVYRDLMRYYLQLGNTVAALKTYEQLRTYLIEELGADPSPQTQALHQSVLNGQLLSPSLPKTTRTPQPSQFDSIFVGREAERQALLNHLSKARQGSGNIVSLIGEAGVGKSRLASEVLARAARQNIATLSTRCQSMEQTLPFAPIIDALESFIVLQPQNPLAELPKSDRAQLTQLLPSLAWQVDADLTVEGISESNRQLLVSSLVRALLNLARKPIILFIDDLQWVDEATLTLLANLSRYLSKSFMLVMLAYRQEEVAQNPPLEKFLRNQKQQRLAATVELRPFSVAETETYLHQLAPDLQTEATLILAIAERLHQLTGGNLLFLTETLRALLDDSPNALSPAQAQNLLTSPALEHPSSQVSDVILARLRQLSAQAQNLLEIAAVIGRDFSLDLLETISANDPLPALNLLLGRQFLVETEQGRLDFSHHIVREALYKNLSPLSRQRLHHRAAQALILLYGKQAGPKAAEISAHSRLAGAGNREQALRFAILAGAYAMRSYGFEQAIRHYRQAIDLSAKLPYSMEMEDQVSAAYQGLGQAYESMARWSAARSVYNDWRNWARDNNNLALALRAQHRLASMLGLIGQLDESAAITVRLTRQLPAETPTVIWDVQERLGALISTAVQPPTWTDAGWPVFTPYPLKIERPWEEIARFMGANQAAQTLNLYGWTLMLQGHTNLAEATFYYAIRLAETYNQPGLQATSYNLLAQLSDLRGDYIQMEQAAQQSLALVENASHLQWAVIWGRIHRAYVDMRWNRLDRAETRLTQLRAELSERRAFRSHCLSVEVGLGLLAMFRKDISRAADYFERVLDNPKNLYVSNYMVVYLSRARLRRKMGQLDAAQQDIIHAMTFAGQRGMLADYISAAVEAARFDRATDQAHHITPLLQKMETMASRANLLSAQLSVRLALMRVFEQLGSNTEMTWYRRLSRADRDAIAASIPNSDDRAAYLSRRDLQGL